MVTGIRTTLFVSDSCGDEAAAWHVESRDEVLTHFYICESLLDEVLGKYIWFEGFADRRS